MKHTKSSINSDTDALINRAAMNSAKSKTDLDDWIISSIGDIAGKKILDLGCGTGKQIFKIVPHVGKAGMLTGFDLSEKAVQIVNQESKEKGLENVQAFCGDLDDYSSVFAGKKFDLIISTYAIYYSQNLKQLLIGLKSLLNNGGRIFVCGYGAGSNQEVISKSNEFAKVPEIRIPQIENFISDEEIAEVSRHYKKNEQSVLENRVSFYSPAEFLQWWKNHSMFRSEVEKDMTNWINDHFKKEKEFSLTKNVFALHLFS